MEALQILKILKIPKLLKMLKNKGENTSPLSPRPADDRSGRGEGCSQGPPPPSRALYHRCAHPRVTPPCVTQRAARRARPGAVRGAARRSRVRLRCRAAAGLR